MKKNFNNIKNYLQEISSKSINDIFTMFNSNINGLNLDMVENNKDIYGENKISYKNDKSLLVKFLSLFLDPFILILIGIVIISYFTDVQFAPIGEKSYATIIIIGVMILIAVVIQFIQEYDSTITSEKLQDMVTTKSTVLRDGKTSDIDMEDLVPGDIIRLSAGDIIPGDLRIISCQDLFINQSSLTGESNAVEKTTKEFDKLEEKNIDELNNICLMGTTVISGSCTGIIIATGNETYFGSIAETLTHNPAETSFETGVKSVSYLLIKFMLIMVPVVFVINGITKGDWLSAFLFSISIAVGLTPEMLPTIVSSNLAKGANTLSSKKIVVKNLSSIQNFGAMDILCTDKTGTLTLDQIVLEKYLNVNEQEDMKVLKHGYLNSYFQTGLKNLMDIAVINRGNKEGLSSLNNFYEKIDEIPFDFERRRMSVVLKSKDNKRQLITKGALEEILSISTLIDTGEGVIPLTDEIKTEVLDSVKSMNLDGMRVIGVAQKNDIPDVNVFSVKDESEMVLIGYMAFLDPPKESAKPTIKSLVKHGVTVKVLTGDNEFVTKKVCEDVGISSDKILLGNDIDNMTDGEIYEVLKENNIFAKLSPLQKERIIHILQDENHVVGFLGDGINDAPSLKTADVGISVDTAVDIAKESADLILLEKDLAVLETGVLEGRRVFGNIIKYIKMTVSSNFGNVFSVLVASAFLPFLPMLPLQLLTQNLLYSISQIAIPWDNMDEEYLAKPQKWNAKDIGRFMVYIGPVSSIFDILTFAIMYFIFKANNVAMAPLFQSGWFVVGLLTQTLIVHLLRTEKVPFLESRAARPLTIMTIIIMAIGIILPYTFVGSHIGLLPLPLSYFPWLIGILVGYVGLTEIMKRIYIKKFGTWL